MKVSEIQELIKFVSKSGVSEVEIEHKDFKINIKTPPFKRGIGYLDQQQRQVVTHQMIPAQMPHAVAQPVVAAVPAPVAEAPKAAAPKEDETANYLEIKSPMIGTFYRRAAPDKPEFAKVGDSIGIGDTVCVIEAMKLFNEIESEVTGKIVKVLVDDTSPVEYDQVLFLVDPAG
ncbi:MAG: acetyl-CoA carboxylase biotin carboxyl carrier protein [Flavobacteriales bacterium]|nr:acetyl-CoA carboxylase biotin carboxyl carrier protein [Flavobacteriales bacterium]